MRTQIAELHWSISNGRDADQLRIVSAVHDSGAVSSPHGRSFATACENINIVSFKIQRAAQLKT
jgi:hypothetical protein